MSIEHDFKVFELIDGFGDDDQNRMVQERKQEEGMNQMDHLFEAKREDHPRYKAIKDIVDSHSAKPVPFVNLDGKNVRRKIDAFTAQAVIAIANGLGDKNFDRYMEMPLEKFLDVTMKLMK